jgi:pyridoxal phosphate enzyme (YggS family)
MNTDRIRDCLLQLRERVAAAQKRAGRTPEPITIVGVTKKFPPELVAAAAGAGLQDIGENRVQELVAKQAALPDLALRWHLVGPLQTNKINKILGRIFLLQSLDRMSLAEGLQKRLKAPLDCLVEVNISGEASKHGVAPDRLPGFLDGLGACDKIRVRGLMTVGPLTGDQAVIRRAFQKTAALFEREKSQNRPGMDFRILSMGMSDDFEIAVEEGSTMIRVGTALFGPRPRF